MHVETGLCVLPLLYSYTALLSRGIPVEVVGRAMAEDAVAYHTASDQEKETRKQLVADNTAIHRLAQPKVSILQYV